MLKWSAALDAVMKSRVHWHTRPQLLLRTPLHPCPWQQRLILSPQEL